jgi:hypothetical protein
MHKQKLVNVDEAINIAFKTIKSIKAKDLEIKGTKFEKNCQ